MSKARGMPNVDICNITVCISLSRNHSRTISPAIPTIPSTILSNVEAPMTIGPVSEDLQRALAVPQAASLEGILDMRALGKALNSYGHT